MFFIVLHGELVFQSTPPARGATTTYDNKGNAKDISIHAPREGSDYGRLEHHHQRSNFNPRPPRGGRLNKISTNTDNIAISIHAPREGGDHLPPYHHQSGQISIHAPREGGDPMMIAHPPCTYLFQSTPPARGATPWHCICYGCSMISIHAPREGGDIGRNQGSGKNY